MIHSIEKFILKIFSKKLAVFLCSMLPIIELRGAVPLGASLGLRWYESFFISIIGNMLPVPFILLFIRAILELMKKTKKLSKIALWLEKKADKNKDKINKYSFWGLFVFVAIPLPGTGAWTGSLVAALMKIRFGKAFLAVLLGVITAGVILTLASYGVVEAIKFLI